MTRSKNWVITLLCMSLANAASAGVNVWTTNGPARADVRSLAIDPVNPATLYAGTSGGGVIKSTDSGSTWTASNTGLTTLYIQALAVNPAAPATLYAGTPDGGVFKSTDGGRTWAAVNTGLTSFYVTSLAIDRSTPTTLYAGTYRGVFKSDDSGRTWEAVNTGLTNQYVYALTINPVAPATLYAGTIGPRVFKSIDSGATWAAAGAGLEPEHPGASPEDDPWLTGVATALAIDPATPAILYAGTDIGLFKSFDGGGSWTVIDADVDVVTALAIDPANPATIYVGRRTGVVRSTDGGRKWATVNDGLTNSRVHALAFDSSTPASLYAGTGGGVYEYLATWTCVADSTTLCLNNSRYKVEAEWLTGGGVSGAGQVIPLTSDTGAFWFFSAGNLEVVVKVLNGCGLNSRYWLFAAGLTDVQVVLTVTDTQTGAVRIYANRQWNPFEPIQDTNAFATCP